MRDAAEYLASVKARIVVHPQIVQWVVVREEAQGDMGLLRYRLALRNGGLLEMFERFQVVEGSVQVTKYSFHCMECRALAPPEPGVHHGNSAVPDAGLSAPG